MNEIFDRQIEEIRDAGFNVETTPLPSGARLITIAGVGLPKGWNQEQTAVRFIAPVGYPFAQPDCFWGDPGLLLATGLVPQSTNNQAIPELNAPGTWFSWHVTQWNPNSDSLLKFLRVIEQRLSSPR